MAPLDTRPSTPFTIFFTMSPPGFELASQSLQRLCQRTNLAVAAINCVLLLGVAPSGKDVVLLCQLAVGGEDAWHVLREGAVVVASGI